MRTCGIYRCYVCGSWRTGKPIIGVPVEEVLGRVGPEQFVADAGQRVAQTARRVAAAAPDASPSLRRGDRKALHGNRKRWQARLSGGGR